MPYHTFHALHFMTSVTLHYMLCNMPIHRVESHYITHITLHYNMLDTWTYIHCNNIAFLNCLVVHIGVALNSFTSKWWKWTFLHISLFFRQTWANPMFIFSGTCCPSLLRKTLMCDLLKFVPGACSPVTLHSVAGALKDFTFALRCWSLLTFIGQCWDFHARTVRAPLPPSFLESRRNKSTV